MKPSGRLAHVQLMIGSRRGKLKESGAGLVGRAEEAPVFGIKPDQWRWPVPPLSRLALGTVDPETRLLGTVGVPGARSSPSPQILVTT